MLVEEDTCNGSPEDNDGMTPLYIACQNGHKKVAQILLDKDANFLSCFICAAKKQQEAAVIETCGETVAVKTMFEAVRAGDKHDYPEFIQVSYLCNFIFMTRIGYGFCLCSHSY